MSTKRIIAPPIGGASYFAALLSLM